MGLAFKVLCSCPIYGAILKTFDKSGSYPLFSLERVFKMAESEIAEKLIDRGKILFEAPKKEIDFVKDEAASKLLNDLDNYPHAFVLACIMDRQIKAERAWLIPQKISERIGSFSFETLKKLTLENIKRLFNNPKPLHRFNDEMSVNFYEAIKRIEREYNEDASKIWSDKPSSAEVVYRFLNFRGVGPKIATMAANILARDFKVELKDYNSIDISPDVHVKRVFHRLGFVSEDASNDELIYKARSLHPRFPGLMDLPTWEIGREFCKPKKPLCDGCYVTDRCPKNGLV